MELRIGLPANRFQAPKSGNPRAVLSLIFGFPAYLLLKRAVRCRTAALIAAFLGNGQ
jgi:hypothetical protein